MNRIFSVMALLCPFAVDAVFNPMSGDQLWAIVAETGRIASAIEGTQTRIQSSDIGTTGYVIASPGRYALVENVTYTAAGAAPAISIEADNVFLDLNGFTITGAGMDANLIQIGNGGPQSNVYIGNGTLNSAKTNGIHMGDGGSEIVIDHITVHQANNSGIDIIGGVVNLLITDCNVSDAQLSVGIHLLNVECARVLNTVADQNLSGMTHGIELDSSTNIVIDNCKVTNSFAAGIALNACDNVSISNCFFANQAYGISLTTVASQRVTVESCDLFNHSSSAIELLTGSSAIFIKDVSIADAFVGVNAGTVSEIALENVRVFNITSAGASDGAIVFGQNSVDIIVSNVDIAHVAVESGIAIGDGANNFVLQGISVADAGRSGVSFLGTSSICYLKDCCVADSGASSFFFGDTASDIVIENCTSTRSSTDGFRFFSGVQYVTLCGCKAVGSSSVGFNMLTDTSLILGLVMEDCQAVDNAVQGFNVRGAPARNCTFRSCVALGNGDSGFSLRVFDSLIEDNRAVQNEASNIIVPAPGGVMNAVTGHNVIKDNYCLRETGDTATDEVNFHEESDAQSFSSLYLANAAFVADPTESPFLIDNYFFETATVPKVTDDWEANLENDPGFSQRWNNLNARD